MPPRSAEPVGWALSLLFQDSVASRLALPMAYGSLVLLQPVGSAGWNTTETVVELPPAMDSDVGCPLARPKSPALVPPTARPLTVTVPVPVLVKVKVRAAGLADPRILE